MFHLMDEECERVNQSAANHDHPMLDRSKGVWWGDTEFLLLYTGLDLSIGFYAL